MTRKDYQLIAVTLKSIQPLFSLLGSGSSYVGVVDDFATALQKTYPNFDRMRFEAACYEELPDQKHQGSGLSQNPFLP